VTCLTATVAASAAPAAAQSTPVAPVFRVAPANQEFGFNAAFMFWSMSQASWTRFSALMPGNGVQIARVDAPWPAVEPQAPNLLTGHHYHWQQLDAIAAALAQEGIRWLPLIGQSAPWDASRWLPNGTPDERSAPRDPGQFAHFAALVAARYGPGGAFWAAHPTLPALPVSAVEIWNEPNTPEAWHPKPDARAYFTLYEEARAAIHNVAPAIEVLVGGLSNPASTYLEALYRAGGNQVGLFDGVGLHAYGAIPKVVLDNVAATRQTLDAHGDIDLPLDLTEFGWPVRPVSAAPIAGVLGLLAPRPGQKGTPSDGMPFVSEPTRASYLTQVVQALATSDCGVERIVPQTWVSREHNAAQQSDWYGVIHPDGTETETAYAYGQLVTSLEQQPQGLPAQDAVCQRQLAVAAGPAAQTALARPASGRAASGSACAEVGASSRGVPVDRATARFTFIPDHASGKGARRTVTATTSPEGRAIGCFRLARGSSGTIRITVMRRDFAARPTARVHVRAR
jgi:hypothetical protein